MLARGLDDLLVYRKSIVANKAVSALLQRPRVRIDRDLHSQLASAAAAVAANIAEGFGQQTDRQFVRYLFIARGSAQELRALLVVARDRGYIVTTEMADLSEKYEEVARMLTGLIKYLRASDRKERG